MKYILTLLLLAVSLISMAATDTTIQVHLYVDSLKTEYRIDYNYDGTSRKNYQDCQNCYTVTVTVHQQIAGTNTFKPLGSPMIGWFPGMYGVITMREPEVWVRFARQNKKGIQRHITKSETP